MTGYVNDGKELLAEEKEDDIEALRGEFLNQDFDEVTFDITGERFVEYAKACGETASKFIDINDPDLQTTPTFVSTLVGRRNMPEGFPELGGMGMDAGKGVEWMAPIRNGDTLTGKTHLHDIYTKTGRSGRMVFLVARMELFNQKGDHVANADTRTVIREKPSE